MATTIKTSPELWGESARDFDLLAEENAKKPTPRLSSDEEQKLRDFFYAFARIPFPVAKEIVNCSSHDFRRRLCPC